MLLSLTLTWMCGCGNPAVSDGTTAGQQESAAGQDGTSSPDETGKDRPQTDFHMNEEPVAVNRGDQLTIGFSQIGAESDWRLASSASMLQVFTSDNGYNLIFSDGQQKQENQIKAIRNFIQQQVDYIIFSPLEEDGWDTVLEEAKEAGIPVIIVDRMVNVSDDSLYTAWIGSDMRLEGEKAAEWMHAYFAANGIDEAGVHIVDIQGTIGSSPQIGRSSGLEKGCEAYGWKLLASETGEFVKAKAYEVMESMLKTYPDLNVVYCENDNEAFGALEAIESAGKKAGVHPENGEVLVISFDATMRGLTCVLNGKIAVDAECNPLHGPRVREIIEMLEEGQSVPKKTYVSEDIFSCVEDVDSLNTQDGSHDVTTVTQELIDSRAY